MREGPPYYGILESKQHSDFQKRNESVNIKYKAALFAIASAFVLALSKFSAGLTSGSMAVLSSSLDSLLDIFMSGMNFLAIREAAKPADYRHQYGHGKTENLAAVVQSLVIIFTGGMIVYKAIDKFLHKGAIHYSGLDLGVMILSVIFSMVISTVLRKVGEKSDSSALKADALHYSSDLYSNSAAIVAIVLTYYTGITFFDLFFSVVVAFILLVSAQKIFRDGFGGLMDTNAPSDVEQKLHEIISAMPYPYAGYHKMRSRVAGSRKYVDFHLLICRDEKIDAAHKMADRLEIILAGEIKNLDTVIHIEPCSNPCGLSEETCAVRKQEGR
ncbi:MAG: Ferrous-iron efflux pump FieF [Syntrophorhabdus sp. PtaU1.Bin002]|nr:MAG: Ferrous-iron efflux pump FieF [Syntrophorhabdus sp. PtaU1.Bin002]